MLPSDGMFRAAECILAAAQWLVPGVVSQFWEWTPESARLRLVAMDGRVVSCPLSPTEVRCGEGFVGRAIAAKEVVHSFDVAADPQCVNRVWTEEEGLVGGLAIPVVGSEESREAYGVLALLCPRGRRLSEGEVEGARMLARCAATSLENAALRAADSRRGMEIETLQRISHSMVSDPSLSGVLAHIAEGAARCSRVSRVEVLLLDFSQTSLRVGAAVGRPTSPQHAEAAPNVSEVSLDVARTGRVRFIPDCCVLPVSEAETLPPNDVRAYLGIPIRFQGERLGALTFCTAGPHTYGLAELRFFKTLAGYAAIAIKNAQLREAVQGRVVHSERRIAGGAEKLRSTNRFLRGELLRKSQFLANVSHDLRTPLNVIIGFCSILLRDSAKNLSARQIHQLRLILEGAEHLTSLTEDVLDLSRIDAGKLVLQYRSLDVCGCVREVLAGLEGLATDKRLTLECRLPEQLPPLSADPVRFKQILLNLLSNAIKFTGEEGRIAVIGRLVPMAEPSPDGGGEGQGLELSVSDTGIGIRPEDLPRVFTEFSRIDRGTAVKIGTGLGLAITKRLVKAHRGQITAESGGVGRGATFRVLLPLSGATSGAAEELEEP